MRKKISILNFCLLFGGLILFTGCNKPFEAVKDDENYTFTIYGYLDASADTQWVRVAPARHQLETLDELPEMRVTLTHAESDHTVVMNTTLVRSPDGRHIPLAWTPMDVEPEQTYTLRAERPDGAESHVTVTTPPDFPTPVLKANTSSLSGELIIRGVERVADVQTLWKEKGRVPYRRFLSRTDTSETSYTVSLKVGYDLRYFCQCREGGSISNPLNVEPRQIFVASGGPEWSGRITWLNDLEYSHPNSISNIEGGTGYLIGIVSKTIPFKGCFNDEGENIACPLEKPFRY